MSTQAANRLTLLKAWEALRSNGIGVEQAGQVLDIPRATLYRWRKRLKEQGLRGLEDESRRPKRVRRSKRDWRLIEAVKEWRELYPRWGKEKLCVLLRGEGYQVSSSSIGRIIADLKRRGYLPSNPRKQVFWAKKRRPRPYAVRKPHEYCVRLPGDLVQIDTLDIKPLPGWTIKHFTARDTTSRWDVIEAHPSASSTCAARFLDTLLERMPFHVKALQVDGGSEFKAQFEQACQQKGLKLFVLPPRSPKLNGRVERAHRTHLEEFYQVYDFGMDLPTLNIVLSDWERIYNTVRPHRALDNLTPQQYIHAYHPHLTPALSHMY
jgi:transposase InsO family protein